MVRKIGGRRPARKKVGAAKRKTHRRRGIRGTGDVSGILQKAGGLIVGSVAARELNTLAKNFFPSLSPLLSGVLQMGVGFMLPKFVKGAFFQNLGDGMIANGGMVVVVSTGVISGDPGRVTYRLNGTSRLNVVNGTDRLNAVNGLPTGIQNSPVVMRTQRVRNFK